MNELSDHMLFQALADNDGGAFKKIFERFRKEIYLSVLKWTKSPSISEDIVQDIFMKLWQNRSQLASIQYPKAYIYQIAFNRVKNYLQRENRKFEDIENTSIQKVEASGTVNDIEYKEIEKQLNLVIAQLPHKKQLIYNLAKNENKSYKEIAADLSISVETVRSHLYEIMKYLRMHFPKQ